MGNPTEGARRLREAIRARGEDQATAARNLRLSESGLSQILSGRRGIGLVRALRAQTEYGVGVELWARPAESSEAS